ANRKKGAQGDNSPKPRQTLLEYISERIGDVEFVIIDDAGEHERNQDIKHRADNERGENSARQVALRIFTFFRRGRNGIEPDVSPEYRSHPFEHAANSVRGKGSPVLRRDIEETNRDDRQDDGDFDDHNEVACVATFLDSDINQTSCDNSNQQRRKVGNDVDWAEDRRVL